MKTKDLPALLERVTQGQWTADDMELCTISGASHFKIEISETPLVTPSDGFDGDGVCVLVLPKSLATKALKKRKQDDADLIALAPQLARRVLELSEALTEICRDKDNINEAFDALDRARAILDKEL